MRYVVSLSSRTMDALWTWSSFSVAIQYVERFGSALYLCQGPYACMAKPVSP